MLHIIINILTYMYTVSISIQSGAPTRVHGHQRVALAFQQHLGNAGRGREGTAD